MKFKLKLDELDLDILASIDKNTITDQRKLSSIIGASLGKINYCLKGLINIGFVKIENFSNSQNNSKRNRS